MAIYELEREKVRLQQELSRLTEVVTTSTTYQDGLDVRYDEKTGTRGSKQDIERVKNELNKVENEIKKAKEYQQEKERMKPILEKQRKEQEIKAKEELERSKKLEEQKKRLQEKDNKKKIEALKKFYKRGHLLERVVAKVTLTSPKWKNLKSYSKEELDFLLRINSGDTIHQRERENKLEERMKSKKSSFKQIRKAKKNSRWDELSRALSNKHALESKMKTEEYNQRRM